MLRGNLTQRTRSLRTELLVAVGSAVALATAGAAGAQEADEPVRASDSLRETIVVTGTKQAGGEALQTAPVAVSAFTEGQLDALFFTDIQSLSYTIPNVQLEDIGTIPGTANFSIRGIGVNSSIPSIDPAVAFVQDGVPLAINTGVIFDTFDLAGVEVFRGPQGTLFGRNATGGAVVLNTTLPTDELTINAKAAVETGLVYRGSARVSGPLVDGVLSAKLGILFEEDEGYWENQGESLNSPIVAPGLEQDNLGDRQTVLIRPALRYTPSNTLEVIGRLEYGDISGSPNAAQNRGLNGDSLDSTVDEFGDFDAEWLMVSGEANWDVPFGDGTITNIFGYREFEATTFGDIDSSPLFVFHSFSLTDHEQISNELRYSGRFAERFGVTAGLFYMDQTLTYIEDREIPAIPLPFIGGGTQDVETLGIFAEVDIDVTDQLTFILGGRYTDESKDGQVEYVFSDNDCTRTGCSSFDEDLDFSFSQFTPRYGARFQATDDLQFYATYTEGVRAGGFNFRNTNPAFPIEAFEEETAESIEVGFKWEGIDNRLRLNMAAFDVTLDNLQREVNESDPVAGVVQVITNTADATVRGIEGEAQFFARDNLIFTAMFGLTDGEYDEVLFDISGDGVVNEQDLALDLPRLAPQTYGFGFIYDRSLGDLGLLTARANFNHRSRAKYTDNNLGTFPAADILDASLAYAPTDGNWTISFYGKNLYDEVTYGNDTQLPLNFPGSPVFVAPGFENGTGATFSPLNKGRILGVEAQFRY